MQQVRDEGHGRRVSGGGWLVLVMVGALALLGPARAGAQCCVCLGCADSGFCVDDVANPVACATLCDGAGCPNLAYQVGDTCADGCDGQPNLPTATPTGTPGGTTATFTPTETETPAPTSTETPAASPTATKTPTLGETATVTPTFAAGTATATVTSTRTGSPVHTPTLTPTEPAPNIVTIAVGTAVGQPGSVVGFAVTIDAGTPVLSVQACVQYETVTPINATAGNQPDCTAGASVLGTFAFQPLGCNPHLNCTGACAAITGAPTIPVTGPLFTCRVAIAADAATATYPLVCSADASGGPAPVTTHCTNGAVIVQTRLPGDCNGDGRVTIDELIIGVNIALGSLPITACPAFDTNADGQVSINELIAAVNVALSQ